MLQNLGKNSLVSIHAYYYIASNADATSSGPASIIYNEGGQRAEEDDLDDDDPAPSAYVSRAPSPPVIDSHLPVPEKTYLEVPNVSSSAHSSKSRDPPPELDVGDKGKKRESTSGTVHSRSVSMSRNIPSGIEIPGPIALTDSNSSRRSGSGRLGEALTSVWGNNPPSAGPSANSSVLPSPLEGPTSRSVLLNALNPLASVPEGSAIPEVIHADAGADTGEQAGMFEAYRNELPKTPKAETPRPSASPSRIPVSASAAATSPKPPATPKATSRIPTATVSPRTGGTPRGLSTYSNGSQPPAVATPRGSALGTTSPGHLFSPPVDGAPPEPPATIPEPGAAQSELQTVGTPKPLSRAPTKPPTRATSPQPPAVIPEQEAVQSEPQGVWSKPVSRVPTKPPTRAASPHPPAAEQEVTTLDAAGSMGWNLEAGSHVPVTGAELLAPAVGAEVPAAEQPEPAPAATTATEDDGFWGQPKSKSRKGSKAASKAASKVGSKAATPKGTQTPKPVESTAEAEGASTVEEVPATDGPKLPSAVPSPLATVPEDFIPGPVTSQDDPTLEGAHDGQSGLPGGFFLTNPDAPPDPAPAPIQNESTSFSGFGGALGGGMGESLFGAASSALGWGGFGKNKSKPSTPKPSTLPWGASRAASTTESTGGGGGGWGSATGNNSRSNSGLFGMEPISKSGNASNADLLGGLNADADPTLGHTPAESGGSHLPPFTAEVPLAETQEVAPQEETQGEGAPQDEAQEGAFQGETHNSREHLTVKTDVLAVPDAATAGPTTAGDSPEVGEGGGEAEAETKGGEEDKALDDEWGGIPVKTKKKKGGNTPVTPGTGGGGGGDDDWATAGGASGKKKKKGGKR